MANDKQNTSPNVPNLREQSGIYSGDAERGVLRPQGNVPNKGNVPRLRFPEFTEDWTRCTIGDYGNVITGSTPSTNDAENYDNGTYLWASPADLGGTKYIELTQTKLTDKGFAKTRCFPANSILVTCIGSTIGKMGMSKIAMSTNQQINTIVPTGHDANFVYYALQSRFPRYLSSIAVQAVPIISKSAFEKLENHTTQIDEQNKIGSFLSLLDERINTQNKIIEDLKKLKVAIRDKQLNAIRKHYGVNYQICDLLDYDQPTKYVVTDTEYSDDISKTPVLTANKAFILGYTNETFGVYDKGKCIILDDFTLDCKYVDFPFKVKSSAIKILTVKNGYSLRYVYEYLNYLNLETTEHKRHYISEIEPMMIAYPTDKKKINDFNNMMSSLERKIEIENKYLQFLLAQKAYLLINMFI